MTADYLRHFVGQHVISPDMRGIWLVTYVIRKHIAVMRYWPTHFSCDVELRAISKLIPIWPGHRLMLLNFDGGMRGLHYLHRNSTI